MRKALERARAMAQRLGRPVLVIKHRQWVVVPRFPSGTQRRLYSVMQDGPFTRAYCDRHGITIVAEINTFQQPQLFT
jgi:hypothetical protein